MKNFLSRLPKTVAKSKKRVGRGLGSGRGAKSGRGITRHQRAREAIPLHFEGGQGRMVKRFPLLRGKGRNKSIKTKPIIVTLSQLDVFSTGEKVTVDALIKKNIVNKKALITGVKLLKSGKLTKKLIVEIAMSKSAKQAVESYIA